MQYINVLWLGMTVMKTTGQPIKSRNRMVHTPCGAKRYAVLISTSALHLQKTESSELSSNSTTC